MSRKLPILATALCSAWAWLLIGCCSPVRARESWVASRLTGSPDRPPPYRVEVAFPHLRFERPLDITHAPGSDRLFVAEQGGRIVSFVNDPECVSLDLALDLSQEHPDLTAVYGLTFHPDFERNRYVYLCYVLRNEQQDGSCVSRFTMTRTEPPTLDPASERVIIRWWSGGHNGGCLQFGSDGYLYISTGDGAGPTPPDPLRSGQDVSNLLSAILRIDVDQSDGDSPYRVPPDNPLLDVEGARPEIWAYGFRNPWRMSINRENGDLWVGDVGWQLWEMIYRVEPGGNYGWAVMEGPQPALPEVQRGPTPILPPTVSHPHSEAASITGGYVYHGDRLAELRGAYVYGDYQTGKVWALRHDGQRVTWHEEIAQTPLQLVAFGEDPEGELLLLDYERTQQIYRLTTNPDDGGYADFPRLLSQTGLFDSVRDEVPAPGVWSYAINAEQWADHTTSRRWMAVPGTQPIRVHPDRSWEFPDGSVFAKTVSIELQRGLPASRRRLETQILHRQQGSWRPYTYIWNDDQSDAELAETSGGSRLLRIGDDQAPGGYREQTYRFASRAECQMCHNPWVEMQSANYGAQSASPLAVSIKQWDRTVEIHGRQENQLTALGRLGWLTGDLSRPDSVGRLVNPYDSSQDLNERARSYLDVNCAHCHQPHAGGAAAILLTYQTPLEKAEVINSRPTQGTFGIADAKIVAPGDPTRSVLFYRMAKMGAGRMPRLGATEVDARAVSLIRDWIIQLPVNDATDVPPLAIDGEAIEELLQSSDTHKRAAAIEQLISSTRGALALLEAVDRDEVPEDAHQQVIRMTAGHPRAEVRELFERLVPASERAQRLGNVINPDVLLALPADPERGRELFFRDGGAACKNCHRAGGQGETLGPDLSQIGKKYTPAQILTHLLEPSQLIEPQYVQHLVETVDGRVLSGLLVEKNDREVVLRDGQNQEVRVPAENVEVLVPQQTSLMPELLLRDLTPQEAADLLAFLSSLQ